MDSTPVGANDITQKHQQRNIQHLKEKSKQSTYQRTRSQTQVSQNHRQENLIRQTTEIKNAEDVIKRKSTGNTRNRTLSNYEQR